MKVILSVLALSLLIPVCTASAAEPVPEAAAPAAALCSTPASAAGAAAPGAPALGTPEPLPMAGPCYAKEYCDAGGYVECWGNNSNSTCIAGPEYVECDGQRKECPCQASVTCYGGTVISCTGGGWVNECEEGPYWVNCNEHVTYCPVTCTAACEGGFPNCKGYTAPGACFHKPGLYIRCDDRQISCDQPW